MKNQRILRPFRPFLLAGALTLPALLHAQAPATVQWADKVVEVSSTNTNAGNPNANAAKQALGKPSRLPATGLSDAAWAPANSENSGDEYIRVSFPNPMPIQQVAVAENHNPGTIYKIIGFDPKGAPHVLWQGTPGPTGLPGRMGHWIFPQTDFPVASIMLVLRTAAVPDVNQIDAIAISSSSDSVKATINIAQGLPATGKRENLGPNVNSATEELCPVITPDGKTLYFTRQGHPDNIPPVDNQDIWFSNILPDGSFAPAQNMGGPLNNPENSSVTSITPDGNRLMLLNRYFPDKPMDKGVSIARKSGDSWEFPTNLEITDFYNDNLYGEYCLSPSGKELIMTLQRKDSYGGKDLYVSFLKDDGTWTAPQHMGPDINSAAGETSPFLAADATTMYFSTDGFPGYGRKDMFLTRRLDDTWLKWSEPENLGPALNTPGWDAYYSIPASGEYAYFVSYSDAIGGADIFRAKLPDAIKPKPVVLVRGRVLNAKTGEPIGGNIAYERLSDGKELGIAYANPKDGSYSIALPAGEMYGFRAEAPNFFPVSENVDLTALKEYRELERDLRLIPVEVGATIRINNLFFDVAKWTLRTTSISELNRLVKILDQKPTMTIEIVGHTDSDGTDEANNILSKNRAGAVRDYLVKNGVNAARLSVRGDGERNPLVPNDTPDNRQINRRVEFVIKTL